MDPKLPPVSRRNNAISSPSIDRHDGHIVCGRTNAKWRVAVFDFDNPPAPAVTSRNPWAAGIGAGDVGQTIADLPITKLVRDGNCTVIERKELKRLLDEQNFSNGDRVDPTTAALVGRILGVDAILVGSAIRDDHADRTAGRAHSFGGFRVGDSSKTTHEITADVELTARIVSPVTAEILAVADGSGVANRKGVKEGIRDTVDGAVADVTASRIVINVGSAGGMKTGDHRKSGGPADRSATPTRAGYCDGATKSWGMPLSPMSTAAPRQPPTPVPLP
ncbi:MAG TPA: CsgG/HfaB family protein [Bryobacteraceae bacterium]|nr:CsgG/HfaB family protein [Bryobacteraceae bacterium]